MAVKLRLMRLGRKGQPFYRIVVVDSRKRRDGAYIEKIGHYNPLAKPAEVILDDARALKWLHDGAIPSDTVRSLLSRRGIMLAFDLQRRGLTEEEINTRVANFRLEKEAALQKQESRKQATLRPAPVVAAPIAEEAKPAEESPAAEAEIVPPASSEAEPPASEESAS